MEILRVAKNISSNGIEVTIEVPGTHTEAEHVLTITDMADRSVQTETIDTAGGNEVTFYLNSNYDNSYSVNLLLDGLPIFSEEYDVVRPYTDPNLLGTTASEISDYTKWEMIARSIIDSHMENVEFYNKKSILETEGSGSDYVPVWKDATKVLKVYENNVLVYDIDDKESYSEDFNITLDKSAIYRIESGEVDRISSPTIKLPTSRGDLANGFYNYGLFPAACDYVFVLETGFQKVPKEVKQASELLIDDLKCGRLDYYQKYVTAYNTDQFRIQFDKKMLEGTGNMIVDKILDKYMKSITRVGVL